MPYDALITEANQRLGTAFTPLSDTDDSQYKTVAVFITEVLSDDDAGHQIVISALEDLRLHAQEAIDAVRAAAYARGIVTVTRPAALVYENARWSAERIRTALRGHINLGVVSPEQAQRMHAALNQGTATIDLWQAGDLIRWMEHQQGVDAMVCRLIEYDDDTIDTIVTALTQEEPQ
jgi:hypothetical protein